MSSIFRLIRSKLSWLTCATSPVCLLLFSQINERIAAPAGSERRSLEGKITIKRGFASISRHERWTRGIRKSMQGIKYPLRKRDWKNHWPSERSPGSKGTPPKQVGRSPKRKPWKYPKRLRYQKEIVWPPRPRRRTQKSSLNVRKRQFSTQKTNLTTLKRNSTTFW